MNKQQSGEMLRRMAGFQEQNVWLEILLSAEFTVMQ
jgi:hypothetical protein